MQLVMTLLCRNEEDIVAANIDFHLRQGVDFIIATDNNSSDRTAQILGKYQDQGVLRLLHTHEMTHDQSVWVTRMARMAVTDHGADWVINSDADEFWWPTAGDLKRALCRVADDVRVLDVKRTNFLPSKFTNGRDRKFFETMRFREAVSYNAHGKHLPPKVCHRADPDILVCDGNHSVVFPDGIRDPSRTADLEILHFPVRTFKQLERKIILGTKALESNQRLSKSIGSTWRKLYYEYYQTGRLETYFERLTMENANFRRNLDCGHVVEDLRLRNFLSELVA